MYKATLTSLLNQDPTLSHNRYVPQYITAVTYQKRKPFSNSRKKNVKKDNTRKCPNTALKNIFKVSFLMNVGIYLHHDFYFRLERVRQRQEYNAEEQPVSRVRGDGQVALFEDYAVLDRATNFRIGNLVRLVLAGNHGPVEYRRPVSYEDPKKDKITAFLQLYEQVSQDGVELRGVYDLKSSEPKPFPFSDLLSHVNLTIAENNRLEIATEELSEIESNVAKLLQLVTRRHNERPRSNAHSQFASDDGIARIVVEPRPVPESSDGLRRSSRTRTAVFFNS